MHSASAGKKPSDAHELPRTASTEQRGYNAAHHCIMFCARSFEAIPNTNTLGLRLPAAFAKNNTITRQHAAITYNYYFYSFYSSNGT